MDVRFGTKCIAVKVDRRSGAKGIAGLKNLVSSWKAEAIMSPSTGAPPPSAGRFSIGVSGGGGGGGGGGGTDGPGGSGIGSTTRGTVGDGGMPCACL